MRRFLVRNIYVSSGKKCKLFSGKKTKRPQLNFLFKSVNILDTRNSDMKLKSQLLLLLLLLHETG